LVFVESNSNEFDAEEESLSKSLVRQSRQVTVPQLVNALGIFLGQLLTFVSNLLAVLEDSLPIILGALGLGGLDLDLDVIVSQLGVIDQTLSSKKSQEVTLPSSATDCAQVLPKLNAATTAATNINNLASVAQNLDVTPQLTAIENALNTILNLLNSPNPPLTTIQSTLNEILTNLNNAIGQVQSTINTLVSKVSLNAPIIFRGFASLINCIAELGSNLIPIINELGVSQFESLLQNVISSQKLTTVNLSTLHLTLFAISNATVVLLQHGTVGFGNITVQALISCVHNPTG
jgi:hypothetical protein